MSDSCLINKPGDWPANDDDEFFRAVESNFFGNNDTTTTTTLDASVAGAAQQAHSRQNPDDFVLNPSDKTALLDSKGDPVTVARILATKPLRHELLTRPGPGGRKLTYMAGESVTRTLNDIFGFDGWHMQIIKTERTVCEQEPDKKNGAARWSVAYMAHVRITHARSGTYKEDLGAGDSLDKHLPTAIQHAMKASITDALKRAARHFGDKLGNILYQGNFSLNSAPKTLRDALEQYEKERILTKGNQYTPTAANIKTENQQQQVQQNTNVNTAPSTDFQARTITSQPARNQIPASIHNIHTNVNKNYVPSASNSTTSIQRNNANEQSIRSNGNFMGVPNNVNKPMGNAVSSVLMQKTTSNSCNNLSKPNSLPFPQTERNYNDQNKIIMPSPTDSTTMKPPTTMNSSTLQQQQRENIPLVFASNVIDTPCSNSSSIQPPRTSAEGLRTTSMFGGSNSDDVFGDTLMPLTDTSSNSWLCELNRPVTSAGRSSMNNGVSPSSMMIMTPVAAGSGHNDQNKRPAPVTVPHGGASKRANISNPYS